MSVLALKTDTFRNYVWVTTTMVNSFESFSKVDGNVFAKCSNVLK